MKTPRELILERHRLAEAKLKAIRAEDLAACTRSAAQASRQRPPTFDLATAVARFWQEALWPWRRAWLGIAAAWVFILAFSLATGEAPRTASTKRPRPDPEVLAVLQEQKQLLTQLLDAGTPPHASRPRTPGPRSAAEPCSLHASRCSLAVPPFPSPPLEERGRERRSSFSASPPDLLVPQPPSKCAGDLGSTPATCAPETFAQA